MPLRTWRRVDTTLRRVFAAGNLLHAADTADIAALGGRHAARQIAGFLHSAADALPSREAAVPVTADPPLLWISPNAITVPGPRTFRAALGSARPRGTAGGAPGRAAAAAGPDLLLPGRSVRLAAGRIGRVDPGGGPVHVNVRLGRRFRSGSGGARTTASIALEAVLGRHRPAWPDAAAALIAGQAA